MDKNVQTETSPIGHYENMLPIQLNNGFSNSNSLIHPFVNGINHRAIPMRITIIIVNTSASMSFFVTSLNSSLFGLFLYSSFTTSIMPCNVPIFRCFVSFGELLLWYGLK